MIVCVRCMTCVGANESRILHLGHLASLRAVLLLWNNPQAVFLVRGFFMTRMTLILFGAAGSWQCTLCRWQWSWSVLQKLKANSQSSCPLVWPWIWRVKEDVTECIETGTAWCCFRHHQGHQRARSTAWAPLSHLRFPDFIILPTNAIADLLTTPIYALGVQHARYLQLELVFVLGSPQLPNANPVKKRTGREQAGMLVQERKDFGE